MRTNFSAARHHLEEAYRHLADDDELSRRSRQAIEILIDAFLAAEFSGNKDGAKIIDFKRHHVAARG